jgi:ribonucleoside-diphosphate reductase alpha chain
VAQGTARRGAWAGYLPIDHKDFQEVVDYVEHHPDDLNIGWIIPDSFVDKLNNGDSESLSKYQRALKVKAVTGKGYFFFVDKVNRLSPASYKERGLDVKASNLCTEICLHSDDENTFTCVLSSMNLSKWDEWKDTDAVFSATVFLDCVASEFIALGSNIKGIESAVNFTRNSRALGLGALGFHTYLQDHLIAFESFNAHMLNLEMFKHIKDKSDGASKWMAGQWGEPEWCRGSGFRNSHRLAIAPNTSSALICGGVSQGIEPIVSNVYNQQTSAGEIARVNPSFLRFCRERGTWSEELLKKLIASEGSVQQIDWLSDEEKLVFKTAYEIDQHAILRLAAARQQHIDQAQSINLFFDANEDEEYISEVHKEAFLNPMIKSLYYMRTKAGVRASKNDCVACEG